MSKRKEEQLRRVQQNMELLMPSDNALSLTEVTELLDLVGCDSSKLQVELHRRLKDTATSIRTKGKTVPSTLQTAIDLTADYLSTPKTERVALIKAKQWLSSFTVPATCVPTELQFQRAYRKSGDLSDKDEKLISAIEDELKRKLKSE